MAFLIDTNIISELQKGSKATRFQQNSALSTQHSELFFSALKAD